jgi:hypothetical protein
LTPFYAVIFSVALAETFQFFPRTLSARRALVGNQLARFTARGRSRRGSRPVHVRASADFLAAHLRARRVGA